MIGSLILIAWPLKPNLLTFASQSNKLDNKKIQQKDAKDLNINNYSSEYSLIVLFSTLGASLLISSSDLVSMYLSIELQSFGLYILSTLYRDSESSTSAGLKYFLLGGLSSCLILLGAGLIYAFTGLTNFESIYSLISVSEINYIIQGLSLGLILIIVGFLFKISAAPLHNWSPDVYDDTPTIVTIWLTIMPKISILILLLELHTQIGFIGGLNSLVINTNGYAEFLNSITSISTNINKIDNGLILSPLSLLRDVAGDNSIYVLKNLLLISSLLSLIIGSIVGLAQTRIKRLLAYSTISHIGFILLALAINTEQSVDSLLFYIIQYSITNLNIFLIIIALGYIVKNTKTNFTIKDIKFISELKGQFFLNPLLSLSLSICLFSMAGVPPLIGFFSKQFVLYSAVQSGYYFIAIVAILVSVVSASYYLKIIKVLHTETENIKQDSESILSNNIDSKLDNYEDNLLTNFHSFLISSLTLSILLFILKPSLILNSTQLLSLSLFNL
jgi:NADH-ubiquinone oxidoreductase chain 2